MFREHATEEIFTELYSQRCPALEPEQDWHDLLPLPVEGHVVSLFNLSNLIFYVRIPTTHFADRAAPLERDVEHVREGWQPSRIAD